MTDRRDIDELSGIDTTGHSWDGIKELNNPLPRWWLWTLYATIAWAIAYCIAYPAWPLLNGATQGLIGWGSRSDFHAAQEEADQAKAVFREKIAQASVQDVLSDADMRAFAVSAGASLFKVNCVQCHGSGAQGAVGYPNLNDDSWLWGGKPEQIEQTISYGVRDATSEATRASPPMPNFGKDQVLNGAQISQVVEHVLALAKLDHDAGKAQLGAQVFAENCASCHGDVGQGNPEFGAPQLNDAVWLYGGTREHIAAQVNAPRHGVMPAWLARLGPSAVKELTIYVHSLGGGQ